MGAFGWIQAGQAKTAQASAESNLAVAQTAQKDAKAKQELADSSAATAVAEANAKATALVNEENARATAQAEKVRAEEQAKIALSRQLAAQAQVLVDEQFDLALLLAIEASHDSTDGKLALSNLLLAEPHLIRIIDSANYLGQGDSGFIEELTFSPDGTQLVAKSYDRAGFWNFTAQQSWELDNDLYQQYLDAWAPSQILTPNPEELLQSLEIYDPNRTAGAVPNRVAFASCRTRPSAGGAPGCSSLIYVVSSGFENLITPLANCSPNENPRDFQINLKGGQYQIQGFKNTAGQLADFDLYSVALANKASNQGGILADARYNPETNRLATAAAVERHNHELDLILWDLTDKRPVLEFIRDLWGAQFAQINFSDNGAALDICVNGSGIQVDIHPKSWQDQACEIAGRNFMQTEWRQYFPGEEYRITCPQWPVGK